jgi:hypothetical protein
MKLFTLLLTAALTAAAADVPWQARLQYIEACSCNLFCPCYYNKGASHQHTGEAKCTFSMATRVVQGKHGDVDLTGMKYWLNGDLGPDWATKGQAGWLVVTFEPKATKEQKDGLMAVLTKLYPVKWTSVDFDTSEITWSIAPDKKTAQARLGNGKGEIKLTAAPSMDPSRPPQATNTKYFGATWNSAFDLYHSDHSYKGFGKAYAPKQANGFIVTVEMTSDGKRVASAAPKKTE